MSTLASPCNLIDGVLGYGTGDLRLTEVRLLDDHGEPRLAFECGEAAVLSIAVRAVRAVRLPNLGFSVVRPDGELVFAISTKNLGLVLPDLAPGDACAARIRVELLLRPGEYLLAVVAGDTYRSRSGDSGTHHDTRERLGPILVRPSAASAGFEGMLALPTTVRLGG